MAWDRVNGRNERDNKDFLALALYTPKSISATNLDLKTLQNQETKDDYDSSAVAVAQFFYYLETGETGASKRKRHVRTF